MDLHREYHHNDCCDPRCKGSPSRHRLVCSVCTDLRREPLERPRNVRCNIGDLAEASGLPFAEYGDPDYPHGYCYREEPLSDALWEAHGDSCQNYAQGYFTPYQHMVKEDLDLVVFLGDCYCELCAGAANGIWLEPPQLDRETRNAVARVRARVRKSERLRIVMRMTRRRPASGVRPRWTAPTNAERELVVLQSMGPDLASVYLLERGVL